MGKLFKIMVLSLSFYTKVMEELIKVGLNYNSPVLAVLLYKNKIMYVAFNDAYTHGETKAIVWALKHNIDLTQCTLVVTLEPCAMCLFMACTHKLNTIVFGAYNLQYGACSGKFNLLSLMNGIHRPVIIEGILEQKCSIFIKNFFQRMRRIPRII